MTSNIRSLYDLYAAKLIPSDRVRPLVEVVERYPVALTEAMAGLIDRDRPEDPIARQFVPTMLELDARSHEEVDPIGDDSHSPVRGVVHRHPDRILLKATGVCPVYCRFCFRKEMVGPQAKREMTAIDLQRAAEYVAGHPAIREVIVTGGDPFVLSAERIRSITETFSAIPHVRILRWHTRVPLVAPSKVTDAFVGALATDRCAIFVAIHANHAREFTDEGRAAIRRLRQIGVSLLGQTVLLQGVNDNIRSLSELMMAFVEAGVKPYYLHHPDLARGTGHFRVSLKKGVALMDELRRSVTGLALPTYVLDLPGGIFKVPLPGACSFGEDGTVELKDPFGNIHLYRDAL
ncbi:lysine-2,3-aminomutase-like protein [Bradyrhizobium sp. BR 10261]|uniref:lysine-2,3-aminomutase-like protein n=1 Tax=Bradyrhizobium sp. BR 10261 TaxID=2749992 RepID=UPI001C64C1D0|nr:lysine-2,3-aminomutase-like protein [Bradyrhizobium sp. BR 10261]MBW7962980.1 lysine-2,3-aminomutase-like protein [Bradyrhizobium sp. BR 10261]